MGAAMLISEFARKVGLTSDAARFYVRLGLLKPTTGAKGGNRPYQIFSEKDVEAVALIRILQALGLPLREIAVLLEESAAGRLTPERSRAVLQEQLAQLQDQRAHLDRMIDYIAAKLEWLDGKRPLPRFEDFARPRRS